MMLSAFLYGTAIFFASLVGGILPLSLSSKHNNSLKLAISFGAGLLLGMAFLHMVPEAVESDPHYFGYWLLAGFVILLILERFVMVHACEEHGCHYHTVGVAAFAGLTVHGLIEGLALGSTLSISNLGPLILVAILSHKVPAGFALTAILRMTKLSTTRIIAFVVGVSASGPIGIALSLGLLNYDGLPRLSGSLLALSAGSFIYIGACDLLPEMHRENKQKVPRLACFLLGILLSGLGDLL
jgi:zinc and cadmium transporter